MAKTGLECNIGETFTKFADLTASEMTKAAKRALRAGAKELQKQTRANAQSGMSTNSNQGWYDGKIVVYTDKVEDAVMISKVDGDFETELNQKVHVMGTRKSGSQTYKFRFLEKGTKERYAKHGRNRKHELITLKKPKYLGRISGRWFFRNAQQQVFPNLPSIYMKEIDKTIDKLNKAKL